MSPYRNRMLLTVLATAILLATAAAADADTDRSDTMQLLDFEQARSGDWEVVNDGVMGGRSKGHVEIADGALRFHGELVTRGGGFTSVRTSAQVDLSGFDGLELRVRGNGRTFELEINDGQGYGRRTVSRRAAFPTGEEWQLVRVPFEDLRATVFGRQVDVPSLDASAVARIGFYIVDGIDGPFWLEVDRVRAYARD